MNRPRTSKADPTSGRSGSFTANLVAMRCALDASLAAFLEEELDDLAPRVAEAVRYSVLSPGKRIRPFLLMAAYRACGGESPAIADLAISVELVHAYSLVHDDLPCMDDDVLRRGRPTVHVKFGVPVAVLTGAALMPLAVRAIVRGARNLGLADEPVSELVRVLTKASGASGMVGGQLLDLQAEGRPIKRAELERIHMGKTARLIEAAVVMGGIAAGATGSAVGALHRFGRDLGLAFQAVDDILDMKGTAGELGKESGRDLALGKATYPSLFGLEEAERISREFADSAIGELSVLPHPAELEAIASYVIERRH